jgi:hypothetical protein
MNCRESENKLIKVPTNYYLILISDSIMVPCYGRKTLNTKGCGILVFWSKWPRQ